MTMPERVDFSLAGKRVWVAGHKGMVGSALVRRLASERCEIITVDRRELDLMRQSAVEAWFGRNRPDLVFLAAARVGGILANDSYPAEFLRNNLVIETNVVEAAYRSGVAKMLMLGSSCIYPRMAPQPMTEEALMTGPLEPTNQWYAIAKIAGLKLAEAYRRQYGCDFIAAMPTNLYGPGDNFDLQTSHVLPALLQKIHAAKVEGAKEVVIWGTGAPFREFLHVDDCADALVFLMRHYSDPMHINVGSGQEITILALAELIAEVVGFKGTIARDLGKPDGTPRKLMDGSRLAALGWKPRIDFREGLERTYRWFLDQSARGRLRLRTAPTTASAAE
jgi:GDP-L-fucose synthase